MPKKTQKDDEIELLKNINGWYDVKSVYSLFLTAFVIINKLFLIVLLWIAFVIHMYYLNRQTLSILQNSLFIMISFFKNKQNKIQ